MRSFCFRGILLNAVPSNVSTDFINRPMENPEISSSITHHDVNYVLWGNFAFGTFSTF